MSHRTRTSSPGPLLAFELAVALVALLVATGCGGTNGDGTAEAATNGSDASAAADAGDKTDKAKEKDAEKAVPVEVVALERGEIQASIHSTTNLEAERSVKVFSQAARLVQELLVEEGDRVEQGAVLLRLQDDAQRTALAKVQSQYDKAFREYERQKLLHQQQLISDEVFNNATYEVEQLKLGVADAERELGYTEVHAPIAGTITARLVNVGDNLTVGQHLFDLVDFDSIVARIYVPEKELPRLRVGQTAFVTTQGGGSPARGAIDRIAPVVDSQTGTVKVTIAFPREQRLRPGMYVDVDLVTERHPDALLVPKRALIYDQDQVFVFKLGDERRVERLLIEPLLEDELNIMPAGGFAAGDQVVIAGQAGLKNNALVRLPGDPEPTADKDADGTGDEKAQVASADDK